MYTNSLRLTTFSKYDSVCGPVKWSQTEMDMVLTSGSVSLSLLSLPEADVINTFTQSQRPHGVWMEGRGGLLLEGARWGALTVWLCEITLPSVWAEHVLDQNRHHPIPPK